MTKPRKIILRWMALPILAGLALLAGLAGHDTAQAAAKNGKLGVALPLIQGPWYTAILYGVTDEAKKRGYDVIILDAGGYAHVDKQVTNVSNLIVQKVKAILMDPINPASFNGVARQAQKSGIPMLGVGSPIVASNVTADGAASSSHCNLGKELAKGARKILPNGGTMAALTGPAGAFWSEERWRCFKKAIAGSNIKIVAEQTSQQDAATALSLASDFLQRFPKVNLLYGADDTYGVGAARAVQQAGRCGKTKVLMAVLGEAAAELMKAGCADYVVAQKTVLIGRTAVRLADELAHGKKPNPSLIEIPTIAVTPANINAIDLSVIRQPKGWTP